MTDRHSPPLLLHEYFDHQARQSPANTAVYEGNRVVTYAELLARSDRVARALRSRGIHDGSLVGLHIHRSIDWVVAMLAILKANAAVVPLPPSDPERRLREILSFGELDAVLDCAVTPFPSSPDARTFLLEDLEVEPGVPGGGGPGHPDQAALVLCSSGTTGQPKMIVRSHRSFFHRLQWTWERHPFTEVDVGCQKAHAATTHAVYELFEPLLAGAPTVIVPDAEVRDLERFWDIVRTRGITRLVIVPTALRATLDMPGFQAPPLDVVVLMGEYLHPGLAERAVEAFPHRTHLYSIYGSTEASSALVCDLRESVVGQELPLGTPISSAVRVLVLAPGLKPVPPGGVGRLYLAGPLLFTGYLKDPTATSSVLLRLPGESDPIYDTRDQVRVQPDGTLHFLARVDHMVKIRGFRVELTEVERAIQQHPGVRQGAVVVAAEADGAATLVGFFTPADVDRSDVYRTVRDRLPSYMVPSTLLGLDRFPLTPSGKVDRIQLQDRYSGGAANPPMTRALSSTERQVAQIWERTLGHGRFGLDSSFFEVGGTSLTVFTLLHHLREALDLGGGQLSAESMYRLPTVESQAAFIDDVRSGRPLKLEGPAPLLVTLRKGSTDQPPLFVVAPAGGTLGAYEKLARALTTTRSVVGVRDPFILGERDPTEGFQRWVERYLAAVRERQPEGPYNLCAYSSGGAFGYEMAHRLRAEGEEVSLLALVDPQLIDRRSPTRFGYWTERALWMRPLFRELVRLAGHLRTPAARFLGSIRGSRPAHDHAVSEEDFQRIADNAIRDRNHIMNLAALLELNTGLPFALADVDFADVPPERYLGVLQSRVARLAPDVDPVTIGRIAVQYPLQAQAQHAYELRPYGGRVLLVEPTSAHAGLLAVLLRPLVRDLRASVLALGIPDDRTRAVSSRFGGLLAHYRCMRDDVFVRALAAELDTFLR